MTTTDRAQRAAAADALCAAAYLDIGAPATGAALVAVGGYGRAELAPGSDLDVVLVHEEGVGLGEWAERIWYPLWDSGTRLDHSVRSLPEMARTARTDLKVALGLLDVRHLAGDPNLTLRLRTQLLAQWRRDARSRLPELAKLTQARHELVGELAHRSVPDLKEAEGGLRDATVLKALVATWLVDIPHVALEHGRQSLLDVRDVLHGLGGRASDRIAPEQWEGLAAGLGLPDALAAQRHVRELGRRMTHLSRLTWRRVDAVLDRPESVRRARRPQLVALAPGVALSGAEVVLAADARPEQDATLLLRAAALAAERDVVLAPATAARLVAECPPLPEPWPEEARQLLVRLLAAGHGLLDVWETLEETGALDRILPEWERIRLLPHASVIHRWTVDRHAIETCIEAGALIREVARPDVLMVAALLHDIGKGDLVEHSAAGEPIARAIAARMGFGAHAVELVGTLVRWHLLLAETATTRDPDDPLTLEVITSRLGDAEAVSLLLALTQADAKATSTQAWSSWRAGLIGHLGRRAAVALAGAGAADPPESPYVDVPPEVDRGGFAIRVEDADGGSRVTVVAPDRVGLLADASGLFALQRTTIRGARAWDQDDVGVSVWDVAEAGLDPAVLRQRFEAVVDGRLEPGARLRAPAPGAAAPTVLLRPEASRRATVLEVRAADRPGVVHLVCAALARLGLTIRSAHVDTFGPQAVDVFYVQELAAGALSDERAADAAHAVRAALSA